MTHRDAHPAAGVTVQLLTVGPEGEPVLRLRTTTTDESGAYTFDELPADCYAVVVTAPSGTAFTAGAATEIHRSCVDPDQTDDTLRSSLATGTPGPPFELTVLHLGDHHGQLQPSIIELELAGLTIRAEAGGFPRVVAAMDAARAEGRPGRTVTVHGGGVLDGTAFSTVFGGAADAALMNRACFDYLTPGPRDLERGPELATFLAFLGDGPCGTDVLAPGPTGSPVGDVREGDPAVSIRATGLDTVAFVAVPAPAPVTPGDEPTDPVPAVQRRIDDLVARGVTSIVVLSSLGLGGDRDLAGRLTGVDAVIGAASRTLLGPVADLGLEPEGPYPLIVENADGEPVCLAHAWRDALVLGELRLGFDGHGRVETCGGQARLLLGAGMTVVQPPPDLGTGPAAGAAPADRPGPFGEALLRSPTAEERSALLAAIEAHPALALVEPDPGTQAALQEWGRALEVLVDEAIGTVMEDLCVTRIPGRQVGVLCGSGNVVVDTTDLRADVQRLVADAFRNRAEQVGGSAVAVVDSGTIRDDIGPGPLAVVQVYRLLPGRATLTLLDLTGAELAAALEEGIDSAIGPDGDADPDPAAYPHTSGLRWKADLDRPPGLRVGPIEVLASGGTRWEPLEPDRVYRVVTTDDLAAGARGYDTFRAAAEEGRAVPTGIGYAQALVDYVENELAGEVEPPDLGPADPSEGPSGEPAG